MGLSDEAKGVARDTGLDKNQSALLRTAEQDPASQAEFIRSGRAQSRVAPASMFDPAMIREASDMMFTTAAGLMQEHTRRLVPPVLDITARHIDIGPISKELKTILIANRGTLVNWMRQHKDSGIPAVLAAFAEAVKVIEKTADLPPFPLP